MASRDKKILIVFLGVLVLILAFFLGYRPMKEKGEALNAENTTLRDTYADLSMKAANADMYQKEMKIMNTKMEEIFTHYPSYLQVENGIMDAVSLEESTKSSFMAVTIADPVAVEVLVGTTTEEATAGNETPVEAATVPYQLYDMNTTLTFETEYQGMKDLIQLIATDTERKSLGTLSASFNTSSGKISGNITYDSYFLYGLDKPYEEPTVPAMKHEVNNIFGTVKTK